MAYISLLLVCVLPPCRAAAQASGSVNPFTCRVLESRRFSNLERIPLEVRLRSRDFDVDTAVLNPGSQQRSSGAYAGLEIYGDQVIGNERKRVPLKFIKTAAGKDLDESYIRYLIEIPIEESQKTQNISKHLDDLVKEAKAKKNTDPKMLRLYEAKGSRQALANTFDRMYMQNRVGNFEINCKYTANRKGGPKAMESRPIKIRIDFKGDFLDQRNFH
jgi:hypothetical protein